MITGNKGHFDDMALFVDGSFFEFYDINDPFNNIVRPDGRMGLGDACVAPMAFYFCEKYLNNLRHARPDDKEHQTRQRHAAFVFDELQKNDQKRGHIDITYNGREMVVFLDTVSSVHGPTLAATLLFDGASATVGDYGLRLRAPHSMQVALQGRINLTSGDIIETGLETFDSRPIIDIVTRKDHLVLLVEQPECQPFQNLLDLTNTHHPVNP